MRIAKVYKHLLLLTTILMSCQDSTEHYGNYDLQRLKGKYLGYEDQMARPNLITMLGDTIVVVDEYALIDDTTNEVSNVVHYFLSENGRYEKSLAKTGPGPGEVISPWSVDNSRGLWLFDLGKYDYLRVSNTYQDSRDLINFSTPEIYYPVWMSDSTLISLTFTSTRFIILNRNGEIIRRVGDYPIDNDLLLNEYMFAKSFQGVLKPRPDQSKIAVINRFYDYIEIWDSETMTTDTIMQIHDGIPPSYQDKTRNFRIWKDEKYRYIDLDVTDEDIFALYSGTVSSEVNPNYGSVIIRSDWDGNIKKVYLLDKSILNVAFSPRQNCLYGVQHEPYSDIVKYQLE